MKYEYIIDGGFYVEFNEGTKFVARRVALRALKQGRWSGRVCLERRRLFIDDLYLTRPEALLCMAFGLPYDSIKESTIGA